MLRRVTPDTARLSTTLGTTDINLAITPNIFLLFMDFRCRMTVQIMMYIYQNTPRDLLVPIGKPRRKKQFRPALQLFFLNKPSSHELSRFTTLPVAAVEGAGALTLRPNLSRSCAFSAIEIAMFLDYFRNAIQNRERSGPCARRSQLEVHRPSRRKYSRSFKGGSKGGH